MVKKKTEPYKVSAYIRMEVTSPKIIPLAVDEVEEKTTIFKSGDGGIFQTDKLPKDLLDFIGKKVPSHILSVSEGIRLRQHGKRELAGVKVNITPLRGTNYGSGVVIKIPEADEHKHPNTNTIAAYLEKVGIDIEKECKAYPVGGVGYSCLRLRKGLGVV